jgi:hypothetical protein
MKYNEDIILNVMIIVTLQYFSNNLKLIYVKKNWVSFVLILKPRNNRRCGSLICFCMLSTSVGEAKARSKI